MKKQATTTPATPATTKNFCAQISTELAAQIDNLAAKYGQQNKPQILAFLLAQTLQNIEKAAAPVLRCENIEYLLECYITAALAQNEPITKQAAQNYIALKTGVIGRKINVFIIDNVLSYYLNEIKAHAEKHNYSNGNSRFKTFVESLEAGAKRINEAAAKIAETAAKKAAEKADKE